MQNKNLPKMEQKTLSRHGVTPTKLGFDIRKHCFKKKIKQVLLITYQLKSYCWNKWALTTTCGKHKEGLSCVSCARIFLACFSLPKGKKFALRTKSCVRTRIIVSKLKTKIVSRHFQF